MRLIQFLLVCLLMMSCTASFAQKQILRNNLKVVVQGDTLPSAWAGAMNAPQFSGVDVDLDGKLDIVTFDREGHRFTPYINKGDSGQTAYRYSPEHYEIFLNCVCEDWALFEDYNCDGLPDLFCGSGSNVDVYDQDTTGGKVSFTQSYDGAFSIYSSGFTFSLFSSRVDLPALADMDDDGDMDILVWMQNANYLELHRNYAMEDYGRCDTLAWRQETACWGHMHEGNATNDLILHDTVLWCSLTNNFSPSAHCLRNGRMGGPGRPGNSPRHVGSTTLVLDLDADNLKDVVIGDVSFGNLVAGHNCGQLDYAYIDSSDFTFPSYDTPAYLEIFPAAFYVDVNNDDIRDLVVATYETLESENKHSVQHYLNMGMDNYPDFRFQGGGFIQGDNLDFGAGSSPTFFDYNQDGLLDLLVGNVGVYDSVSNEDKFGLHLLENVGTADQPIFELVDDNYLGLIGGTNVFARIQPTAGDLDNDNDIDLLLGSTSGEITYFRNDASGPGPANYVYVTSQFEMVDVGFNSAPFLYDIDKDSDLDLFVGNQLGQIAYYENVGTQQAFDFQLVSQEWGFIRVTDDYGGQFTGNSRPLLMDFDNDGEPEMLVGSITGKVEIFEDVSKALTDTLPSIGTLFNFDAGNFSAPAAAVLDSTGSPTILIGNERGGLYLFNTLPAYKDPVVIVDPSAIDPDLKDRLDLRIFPNPTNGTLHIDLQLPPGARSAKVALLDPMGRWILQQPLQQTSNQLSLDQLARGLYFVQIEVDGKRYVEKILKE